MTNKELLTLVNEARNGGITFDEFRHGIRTSLKNDKKFVSFLNTPIPVTESRSEKPSLGVLLKRIGDVPKRYRYEYYDAIEEALADDRNLLEEGLPILMERADNDDYMDALAEFMRIGNEVYTEASNIVGKGMDAAVKPTSVFQATKEISKIAVAEPWIKPKAAVLTKFQVKYLKERVRKYPTIAMDPDLIPFEDLRKERYTEDEAEEYTKVPTYDPESNTMFTCYVWYQGNEKVCGICAVDVGKDLKIEYQVFPGGNRKHNDYYIASMGLACNLSLPSIKKLLSTMRKSWLATWKAQKKIVKEAVEQYYESADDIEAIKNYYTEMYESGLLDVMDVKVYHTMIESAVDEVLTEEATIKEKDLDAGCKKDIIDPFMSDMEEEIETAGEDADKEKISDTIEKELKKVIKALGKKAPGEEDKYLQFIVDTWTEKKIADTWIKVIEDELEDLDDDDDDDEDDKPAKKPAKDADDEDDTDEDDDEE